MTKEEIAARIVALEKRVQILQVELRELYLELSSDVINENVSKLYYEA